MITRLAAMLGMGPQQLLTVMTAADEQSWRAFFGAIEGETV